MTKKQESTKNMKEALKESENLLAELSEGNVENSYDEEFEFDHTSLETDTYYDEENFIGVDGQTYSKEEWFAPIFPEGPSRGQVEIWKNTYGDIYMVPITESNYIVRVLRRGEYSRIREQRLPEISTEEAIVTTCLLHPKRYLETSNEDIEAGIPTALSDVIYEKSGFALKTLPQKL